MGKAYVLKVDGSREDLPDRPTLEEAQKIVGGWVEVVSSRVGKLAYGDEEGCLKGCSFNHRASAYFGVELVGDILVLEGWRAFKEARKC